MPKDRERQVLIEFKVRTSASSADLARAVADVVDSGSLVLSIEDAIQAVSHDGHEMRDIKVRVLKK